MKPKIAVLMPDDHVRKSFITPTVVRELNNIGNVVYNEKKYEPEIMADMLDGAEIAVTGWGCPKLNSAILKKASSLRLLAHTGGSVAVITSPELYNMGIKVISGNKLYAESVAEGTVAYMLTGLRRIVQFADGVQKGSWHSNYFSNEGLLDRKIGIVGFGAISQALVPMLRPFRNEILVYSSHITDDECREYGIKRAETLESLFSSCDIVSLHMAKTKETYHMIDKRLLSLMPDGALLINTARGSVVDEQALVDELRTGRIHAVLDVFEKEPLPADSALRGLDNAILLPHMAGPTTDRHERISLALVGDMKRLFCGTPMVHEIGQEYAIKMTNDALIFQKETNINN